VIFLSIDLEKAGFEWFKFDESYLIPEGYLDKRDAISVRLPGNFLIESEALCAGFIEVSLMSSSLFHQIIGDVSIPVLGNLELLPFAHGILKNSKGSVIFSSLPKANESSFALLKKDVLCNVLDKLITVSNDKPKLRHIVSLL
jgi:hypothetical protein